MSKQQNVSSPSRTYVAICNKTNFDGFYCKKFSIPALSSVLNNVERATWYFLNVLDFSACSAFVMTFEDYSDLSDADTAFAETSTQIAALVNDKPILQPVRPQGKLRDQ